MGYKFVEVEGNHVVAPLQTSQQPSVGIFPLINMCRSESCQSSSIKGQQSYGLSQLAKLPPGHQQEEIKSPVRKKLISSLGDESRSKRGENSIHLNSPKPQVEKEERALLKLRSASREVVPDTLAQAYQTSLSQPYNQQKMTPSQFLNTRKLVHLKSFNNIQEYSKFTDEKKRVLMGEVSPLMSKHKSSQPNYPSPSTQKLRENESPIDQECPVTKPRNRLGSDINILDRIRNSGYSPLKGVSSEGKHWMRNESLSPTSPQQLGPPQRFDKDLQTPIKALPQPQVVVPTLHEVLRGSSPLPQSPLANSNHPAKQPSVNQAVAPIANGPSEERYLNMSELFLPTDQLNESEDKQTYPDAMSKILPSPNSDLRRVFSKAEVPMSSNRRVEIVELHRPFEAPEVGAHLFIFNNAATSQAECRSATLKRISKDRVSSKVRDADHDQGRQRIDVPKISKFEMK